MDEARYRNLDLALKLLGLVGVVGTAAWGIHQYRDNVERESRIRAETAEKEFRRPLWDKQLEIYVQIAKQTAIVSQEDEPAKRKAALRSLDEATGLLPLLGEYEVTRALAAFSLCVDRDCEDADYLALVVADKCRMSLAKTWDQKFADLRTSRVISREDFES